MEWRKWDGGWSNFDRISFGGERALRLGQTTVVHFVSKVIGAMLGFVATVYFARVLGSTVLGQYSLVLAVVSWIGIVNSIGFSGAMTKRISESDEPGKYFSAGVLLLLGLLAVSSTVVFALRGYVNRYVGVDIASYVIVILFATVLWNISKSALKGAHLVHVFSILSIAREALRSALQIALVVLGFRLAGMLIGYAGGIALASLVGLWFFGPSPTVPERRHVVSLFDYAKYSWLGSLRTKTYSWVDIAILGFFVPTGLIGIYSIAWSAAQFLNIFGTSISESMFPEISKEDANDNSTYVATLLEDSLSYAGLIMIPGLVGGILIGDRVLRIYGTEFVLGETVFSIVIASLLVYTYMKQLLNGLNAINRPDLAFRANSVFIVMNVGMNVVMIHSFGWVGAAIATGLSATIGLVVSFYYARTQVSFAVPVREIGHQFVSAGVMGVVVYVGLLVASNPQFPLHHIVETIILVTIGAGTYFLILYGVSSEFRSTVRDNVPVTVTDNLG